MNIVVYPNLKAEMARRGITQGNLAKELGVERAWLNRKLVGKVDISIRLGKRINLGADKGSDFSSIDYGGGVVVDLKKTDTANMDTTAKQTILANNAKQQQKAYVDYGSGVTVDTNTKDNIKANNSALEYNANDELTKFGKQGQSIVDTVAGAVGSYAGDLVANHTFLIF